MTADPTAGPSAYADAPYYVYILECSDGSFYIGMTNNLEWRVRAHNEGVASKYTRSRRPVKLCYQELWHALAGAHPRVRVAIALA